MCSSDIFLGLLAILFPPIAVWVKCGICSADSVINILLCMLGFIPGLLHAWYIIAKYPDPYESVPEDSEGGRVTYVVVAPHSGQSRQFKNTGRHSQRPRNEGYGTTAPMNPNVHQEQNGTWASDAPAGSSGAVPPTYAEAVKGDNKVQTAD